MKISILAGSLIALLLCGAVAWADRGPGSMPPPEAYTACQGKSAGDAASFVTPWGETVEGVCVVKDAKLVLRPDRHRSEAMKSRDRKVPQEALSACRGFDEGDEVSFETEGGRMMTGTCRMIGGELAAVPDMAPNTGAKGGV